MKKLTFEEYKEQQFELIKRKDPAIHTKCEVELYPSFWAVWGYLRAHDLFLNDKFYEARKLSQKVAHETGIEIHPGATIGENFFVDHGHGVVVGETAIVGNDVTLYQGVTLGGTGKEKGKRHPTLGNNVLVGAGAKVLGSITIGNNVKIGAGSVVVKDVPSDTTVVGIPAKIVNGGDSKHEVEVLDQVDIPDPVLPDLEALRAENEELKRRIAILEKKFAEL